MKRQFRFRSSCPVKEEVYRVAFRREVPAQVVSKSYLRVPAHPLIERVVVSYAFDAPDDWIAGEADARGVVITSDILLADRCLLRRTAKPIRPNPASIIAQVDGSGTEAVAAAVKRA